MKKSFSLFLVMIMMMGSFEAWAKKSKTVKTDHDDDPDTADIVMDKCDSHNSCSEGLGCYEADADEFDGPDWWTSMWRRENGKTCTWDGQCDSGNCDEFQEQDGKDDKGNVKYKTVERCAPLKVCKKADFGQSVTGTKNAACEEGLVADLDNKCVSADMFEIDDMLNAGNVEIDATNCSVKIPAQYTVSYRFNYALIQLFNYIFGDAAINDCLGITEGLRHITRAVVKAQDEYNTQVVEGLRAQNAQFMANLHMPTDRSNKSEIDAYNLGLKALEANQNTHIDANNKLKAAYDAALLDVGAIAEYYISFNFDRDAVGNNSDNRNKRYKLVSNGGFEYGIRDRGKHYCRGRSPKIKNSWSRRYRAFDGTHNGLSDYLNLAYGNLQKHDHKHSNEKAYFLLDPPLPSLPNVDNVFKFFGTKASTRENGSSGEARARISKDLIEFMLDNYLIEMYKRFKSDAAFLAKSAGNYNNSAIGELSAADLAKLDQFISDLDNKHMGGKWPAKNKIGDLDHKDEGKGDNKHERTDFFAKHFFVNSKEEVKDVVPTVDTGSPAKVTVPGLDELVKYKTIKIRLKDKNIAENYFYMSPKAVSQHIYDPHLINLLVYTRNEMGLSSEGAIRKMIAFQKLMYDFRQRFYHVIYLFSAGRTKKYPNTERNKFWAFMQSALNANITYLSMMNENVHKATQTCIANLRAVWEQQTNQESLMQYGANNYEKDGKLKVDTVIKGKTPENCGKGQPCQSAVNINAGAINSMKDNKLYGSGLGSGALGKGSVGAMGPGQMAFSNNKKRKAKDFKDTASPALTRARDEANEMLKSILTPPSDYLNGTASGPASDSKSTIIGGGGSAPAKKETVKEDKKATEPQVSSIATDGGDAIQDAQLNFGSKKRGGMGDENTDIPPELAETLLSESKNETYKTAEGDELFTIITKTYIRAGLPRLLQRKVEIKTNEVKHEDEEVFNPGTTKKRLDKLE